MRYYTQEELKLKELETDQEINKIRIEALKRGVYLSPNGKYYDYLKYPWKIAIFKNMHGEEIKEYKNINIEYPEEQSFVFISIIIMTMIILIIMYFGVK